MTTRKKPTLLCTTAPKMEQKVSGTASNIKGVENDSPITTKGIVVEMDIMERWFKTSHGEKFHYEVIATLGL